MSTIFFFFLIKQVKQVLQAVPGTLVIGLVIIAMSSKEPSPCAAVTGIHREGHGPRARLPGSSPASALLGCVPSRVHSPLSVSVSLFVFGLP